MNKLAQSDLLDRLGLRKQAEQAVFTVTRSGFRTVDAAPAALRERRPARARPACAPPAPRPRGVFDLTPTEDEQMLVDVVTEFAAEVVRPAAAEADEPAPPPRSARGRPRDRPADPRGARGARRHLRGALGDGRHPGRRGAGARATWASPSPRLAPGSVATAIALWGTDEQQQTYLPAFTGDERPGRRARAHRAAPCSSTRSSPRTTATRTDDGFVLDGVKSLVPRGAEAELFVVGAAPRRRTPVLFLVESGADGPDGRGRPVDGRARRRR